MKLNSITQSTDLGDSDLCYKSFWQYADFLSWLLTTFFLVIYNTGKFMSIRLTERQLQILDLFATGHSRREVSLKTGLTERQVRRVWDRLGEKLAPAFQVSIDDFRLALKYETGLRSRLESELWATESKLNALMDIAPDAILIVNGRDGKIIRANYNVTVIFGFDLNEIVGSSVEMLVDPDLRSKHTFLRQGFLNSIRKRELGYHPPIPAVTKSGGQVIVDVALTATTNSDDVMVVCRISPEDARYEKRTSRTTAKRSN